MNQERAMYRKNPNRTIYSLPAKRIKTRNHNQSRLLYKRCKKEKKQFRIFALNTKNPIDQNHVYTAYGVWSMALFAQSYSLLFFFSLFLCMALNVFFSYFCCVFFFFIFSSFSKEHKYNTHRRN